MIKYEDKLTRYDEVNFHQKLLNSTINFTEREVERINKDLQEAKSRISNYALLLWKVKDGVDLKNTKQFNKFNREMFSNFKFQVRENARDDIDNFEKRSHYYSWREKEDKDDLLNNAHLIYKRLHHLNEIKLVKKQHTNYNRELVEYFDFDKDMTGWKVKEKRGTRDYCQTGFTLVESRFGSGVDVDVKVPYLVYCTNEWCNNENNQKDLKEKLKKYKESGFVKNFVNNYFNLIDEHIENHLNQ